MILDFSKLHAVLERIAVALEGGASVATDAEPAKRGRGRPAKGETTAAAEQTVAAGQPTPATSAAIVTTIVGEPVVEKTITIQQVADAIINLANSPIGGRDAAVAILAKYSVKKVPELKPEQFKAVLADVEAAGKPVASAGLV